MIAIGVVSAVVMSQNADAGRDPLKVGVFAQRSRGGSPTRAACARTARAPRRPRDRVRDESADVIHSLWIPEMGQKQDVVRA